MAENIFIQTQSATVECDEMIERKGIGHPDTICDSFGKIYNLFAFELSKTVYEKEFAKDA